MITSDTTELDDLPVLYEPREGITALAKDTSSYDVALEALSDGSGPIAIDVERAQTFRYSSKAYLLQLKRAGSGIILLDPTAFETDGESVAQLTSLQELIGAEEWIIHAATQDLPNLVEMGLRPTRLFDTELAGRLLGLPKVGLAALVGRYCGVKLLKEHGREDWSTRPIPEDWLNYAALDVELLLELLEKILDDLIAADKQEWAAQEFEWLCTWALRPVSAPIDPWRKTSGSHSVRTPRGLAVVRELWMVRDRIARSTDRAPSKIVQDKAISELASMITRSKPDVPTVRDLTSVEGFRRRLAKSYRSEWIAALDRVSALATHDLPPLRLPKENGVPAPRNWEHIKPEAWARWQSVRPAVVSLAEDLHVPVENLISPHALKHVLWDVQMPATIDSISAQLADCDARIWQQELVAPLIAENLSMQAI